MAVYLSIIIPIYFPTVGYILLPYYFSTSNLLSNYHYHAALRCRPVVDMIYIRRQYIYDGVSGLVNLCNLFGPSVLSSVPAVPPAPGGPSFHALLELRSHSSSTVLYFCLFLFLNLIDLFCDLSYITLVISESVYLAPLVYLTV